MSGRVDNHRDLQTGNARVTIKTSIDEFGVKIDGDREKIIQRLELVDYKEPDKVDAPTNEKLDAFMHRSMYQRNKTNQRTN